MPQYDPSVIALDLVRFIDALPGVPWFLNVGKPHLRDHEVVRIHSWDEWPGPERGWCHWFGRYQSVVRERIEAEYSSRRTELEVLWTSIQESVLNLAAAKVPLFDRDRDTWYGPTACVWFAAYTACLASWHLMLWCPLPERLFVEWTWYVAGHWPCDYAEEPPGYLDESAVYVPAGKLLVF